MWIFGSITSVIVSLKISSRYYKKMYPRMKLISTELVLIPFGFVWIVGSDKEPKDSQCLYVWHKVVFLAAKEQL